MWILNGSNLLDEIKNHSIFAYFGHPATFRIYSRDHLKDLPERNVATGLKLNILIRF